MYLSRIEPYEVNKVTIFYINFMEFCNMFSKICAIFIFILNCLLHVQDGFIFKVSSWSQRLTCKQIWDLQIAFEAAKHDKSWVGRLNWTRVRRVTMVFSSTIVKFESTLSFLQGFSVIGSATVHPYVSKSIIFRIVYLRPEMKSIDTNCLPEVVTDSPYDFKKILESCPQGAS